jgi:hypothetical protein
MVEHAFFTPAELAAKIRAAKAENLRKLAWSARLGEIETPTFMRGNVDTFADWVEKLADAAERGEG